MVLPLWKTVRRFLKTLKIKLPFDLVSSLLGIYPKKTTTLICIPMFIAAIFTITMIWKQLKCPSMDKETVRYIDIDIDIDIDIYRYRYR